MQERKPSVAKGLPIAAIVLAAIVAVVNAMRLLLYVLMAMAEELCSFVLLPSPLAPIEVFAGLICALMLIALACIIFCHRQRPEDATTVFACALAAAILAGLWVSIATMVLFIIMAVCAHRACKRAQGA